MLLFLWKVYWFFEAVVIFPLRRARRGWREHHPVLSVRLATWAHQRQHHSLYRAIQLFWGVRNKWRFDIAPKFSSWWFELTLPLRPKCKKHNRSLLFLGACFMCIFEEARRKERLQALTSKR